jgi:hypothetical protein
MRLLLSILLTILLLTGTAISSRGQQVSPSADDGKKKQIVIEKILSTDKIVIGDVQFRIASDAVFYAKDKRTEVPFSQFKEGDHIGMSIGPNGEIEAMWFSSGD